MQLSRETGLVTWGEKMVSTARHRPAVKMVVKEETSLLPSSVRESPKVNDKRLSVKRSFQWLQIAAFALMFGWLLLLSVRSWQPVLSEDLVNQLIRGQEVRNRSKYHWVFVVVKTI